MKLSIFSRIATLVFLLGASVFVTTSAYSQELRNLPVGGTGNQIQLIFAGGVQNFEDNSFTLRGEGLFGIDTRITLYYGKLSGPINVPRNVRSASQASFNCSEGDRPHSFLSVWVPGLINGNYTFENFEKCTEVLMAIRGNPQTQFQISFDTTNPSFGRGFNGTITAVDALQ